MRLLRYCSRPPLVRFTIHQRGDATLQFSWTEHHSILDGWSVATKGSHTLNDPWKGHPFNAANNVNGVNGDTNGDDYQYQREHDLAERCHTDGVGLVQPQ